jgi:hypothetical protein
MLPIITALLPVISSVLDRVIPDTAEAAKAKAEMEMRLIESANQAALAQVEVNKAEAASGSVFVGGWRPFIGWVCGAALAYQFIVAPLALWGCQIAGLSVPPPPSLDGMLWELIFGMLGFGGLRTVEKLKGVSK